MKIVNQIINIEDRILLSTYLLSLGYQCSTSENLVSVISEEDLPQELIDILTDMTPEILKQQVEVLELKKVEIREERNSLLKECDYAVLPDADIDPDCLGLFVIYRQQLRDLLNSEDFNPFSFEWPEKPEYVKTQGEV
jgi:hypothetical protein